MTAVGIDAIEIWTGKLKLDLAETFAPAQGDDPGKYTKGLGLHASSFPDVYENIVTMAATPPPGNPRTAQGGLASRAATTWRALDR